ncbi:hypothetical protein TNCV_1093191 [Trichonephila clavipes]|nr:hypothetical protein TNCV_1093191 [Trichonephila clavipes]
MRLPIAFPAIPPKRDKTPGKIKGRKPPTCLLVVNSLRLREIVYLQVDDHVHPGKCFAAVSSEKKQDLLHMEFYHHLPSRAMNEQMSYFSSFSDEWSRDLKTTKEIPVVFKYRNSVHVEVRDRTAAKTRTTRGFQVKSKTFCMEVLPSPCRELGYERTDVAFFFIFTVNEWSRIRKTHEGNPVVRPVQKQRSCRGVKWLLFP